MSKVKIVVHVPTDAANAVRRGMGEAGAGIVGNYTHCSFSFVGTGRFTPEQAAHPSIGEVGKPEAVTEECIEVVCERSEAKQILDTLKKVHPYEEPAYEMYQLIDEDEL